MLGKQVEFLFENYINSVSNWNCKAANIQVIENKVTVGELDYIVENQGGFKHVELAYKIYLRDESLSTIDAGQWIGPNRKDKLVDKLEKLKGKQFPLIKHPVVVKFLSDHEVPVNLEQALCLKLKTFIAYASIEVQKGIELTGYYYTIDQFKNLFQNGCNSFFLPKKQLWCCTPSDLINFDIWKEFDDSITEVIENLSKKKSPMVWIKNGSEVVPAFVVWW